MNKMLSHLRFRWVACQMDALKNCLDYPRLRQTLKNLPKTLDETYSRILEAIPAEHSAQTVTILNLLIWSDHTFYIKELVDAVATNLDEKPAFVPKNRMPVPRDILKLCSSLVAVSRAHGGETVQLAHFSVQEYLVSDRVSEALKSLIHERRASSYLARLCLRYLIDASRLPMLDHVIASLEIGDIADMFPFLWYAAEFWMIHYRKVQYEDESLFNMVSSFLQEEHQAMYWSFKLWNELRSIYDGYSWAREKPSPLNHAARGGLDRMVEHPLDRGADIHADNSAVLYAVLHDCQDTTLRLLIRRGIDVNAGKSEAFLASVSHNCYEQIQLLLDNGADIDARGGQPLQWAIRQGDDHIVHLLLEEGADVNAGDGGILVEAVSIGHDELMQLLINRGADVNARGWIPTALQQAISSGYEELVLTLLEEGENRTTALESASCERYHKIVRLLIEKDAAIDVQDGMWFDTLRPGGWNFEIVEQILKRGASLSLHQLLSAVFDCGPQAEAITSVMLPYVTLETATEDNNMEGPTLLHYAAMGGSEVVVQRCLDLKVDLRTKDCDGRTALHYAAHFGHLSVVKKLVWPDFNLDALDQIRKEPLHRLPDGRYLVGGSDISLKWRGSTPPEKIFAYLSNVAQKINTESSADQTHTSVTKGSWKFSDEQTYRRSYQNLTLPPISRLPSESEILEEQANRRGHQHLTLPPISRLLSGPEPFTPCDNRK
jgi:ankyrin repeat protein